MGKKAVPNRIKTIDNKKMQEETDQSPDRYKIMRLRDQESCPEEASDRSHGRQPVVGMPPKTLSPERGDPACQR